MLRIDPLLIHHRQVRLSCFRNHKIAHDVFPGDVGVDGLVVFGLGHVLQFEAGTANDEGWLAGAGYSDDYYGVGVLALVAGLDLVFGQGDLDDVEGQDLLAEGFYFYNPLRVPNPTDPNILQAFNLLSHSIFHQHFLYFLTQFFNFGLIPLNASYDQMTEKGLETLLVGG